jgi:hypothetical protein
MPVDEAPVAAPIASSAARNRPEVERDLVLQAPFVLGFTTLALLCALQVVNGVAFLMGWPVTPLATLLAAVLAVALTLGVCAARLGRHPALAAGSLTFLLAAVLLAVQLAGSFYDVSGDGRFYHQEAIIQLARGWDPFSGPSMSQGGGALWVDHYPKGAWICAAAAYQLTGRIETGKCVNALTALACFLFALHALLAWRIATRLSVVLAALAALNPVAVYQSVSFCIDGQMAAYLTILTALAFVSFRRHDRWTEVAIAMTVACAASLKFTGGAYAAVLLGSASLGMGVLTRGKECGRMTLGLASGLAVGILVVSFNPYVTNAHDYGHPFHPLAGRGAVDIMTGSTPADLLPMNRVSRLVRSLFARSENVVTPHVTRLKWPFLVAYGELETLVIPDTRVGGTGPLFSGVLVLSALLAIAVWRRSARVGLTLLAATSAIVVSTLIHPQAWWARYAPQLWLIPLLWAAASTCVPGRAVVWLRRGVLFVAALNVAVVALVYFHGQIGATRSLRGVLHGLEDGGSTLQVHFGQFPATRVRFEEFGLAYEQVRDKAQLRCSDPRVVPYIDGWICAP